MSRPSGSRGINRIHWLAPNRVQHVLLPAACAVLLLLRQMACRQNESCRTGCMQTILGLVASWHVACRESWKHGGHRPQHHKQQQQHVSHKEQRILRGLRWQLGAMGGMEGILRPLDGMEGMEGRCGLRRIRWCLSEAGVKFCTENCSLVSCMKIKKLSYL